jgi:hypothetical protein
VPRTVRRTEVRGFVLDVGDPVESRGLWERRRGSSGISAHQIAPPRSVWDAVSALCGSLTLDKQSEVAEAALAAWLWHSLVVCTDYGRKACSEVRAKVLASLLDTDYDQEATIRVRSLWLVARRNVVGLQIAAVRPVW